MGRKLSQNAPGLSAGTVECVLPAEHSKSEIANLRFALWLLFYHAALSHLQATVSVSVVNAAEPVIVKTTISGKAEKETPFPEQYLSDILKIITANTSESTTAEGSAWSLSF